MNKEELLKELQLWEKIYTNENQMYLMLKTFFGASPESDFVTKISFPFEEYTRFLCEKYSTDAFEWHAWENKFGAQGFSWVIDEIEYKINSSEDLVELVFVLSKGKEEK